MGRKTPDEIGMRLHAHQSLKAKIVKVFDGDTLLLQYQNNRFISRARWIDTPETPKLQQSHDNPIVLKHWEWGRISKDYLTSLITNEPYLRVVLRDCDMFDRWISDWYFRRVGFANNLQVQLCAAGMSANSLPCQYYDFWDKRDLALYKGILAASNQAYKQKLGFWSDPNFILPHEFKKLNL